MNKNQTTKHKIIFSSIFLICFVLSLLIFIPVSVKAQDYDYVGNSGFGYVEGAGVQAIETIDTKAAQEIRKTKAAVDKSRLKKTWEQIKTWFLEKAWQELQDSAAIAYKAALKNFLDNLALDMATYLATGDKGQLPMFQTQGWGGYLQNAADNAAGTFLEQLGKNMDYGKFNLCSPNFNVMLKINLGLRQSYKPSKPACTFSTMIKNWDTALQSKKFLSDFQDMFNPWSNDMGIALTVQTGLTQNIEKDLNAAIKDRQEGDGFKAVTDKISGYIKSPSRTVLEAAGMPLREAAKGQTVYTGTIVADSIDIFINTLVGKLIKKWLTQGLVSKAPSLANKFDSLTNPNAQNQTGGVAEVTDRMRSLVEPNFRVRADYDILAELVVCSDPNKAGPTDCVIDEKFRQAIEKKMTVGQALKQGYLNGNGIFGFTSDGLEPKFNEGYPYRTMIILRKYRIIPVGWEIAAQYIKDCQNNTADPACKGGVTGTKNLKDLVECSSSWCSGLVDPNWVLKAPQNFCKREGAGPEIISEQVTGEGSESSLAVLRNDAYCADEQSCIKEKTDGSCQLYGYCTQERRKWDFNAESCEPRNNTCQTFGSPSGQNISYLENTLDFGNCNAGNAGCLAYCRDFNWTQDQFTCATSTGNKIHLNKQAEECDQESEGCHQFIRLNPGGGANLLINSGFEEALDVGGWDGTPGFGATSSTAYQGSISLAKTPATKDIVHTVEVASSTYDIAGESYTLSFYARDCSIGVSDSFSITGAAPVPLNPGADWVRYNLTYTYPVGHNDNRVNFRILSSTCLIDNIKLEPGTQTTAYSDYPSSPSLIYEKLMPSYLDMVCRSNNPPAECNNFARTCSEDEIGCELYTSVVSGAKIPAKVSAQDYCPAECVGYDTFIQSETFYDSLRPAYFIPKTAKACSAEVNGCDQFTNLDEVARGGEGTEYYSYLRQCVKPAAAACSEFYSWEGSDESGYQLKVVTLRTAGAEPFLTTPPYDCEPFYNLPPSDPSYNPDCRQYYNRAGAIFYRLYSSTVSCTDDCHPYKRTAVNIDESITSQATCGTSVLCSAAAAEGDERCWDDASEQCVSCKNGGAWSVSNQACIYNTIKSESTTCAAAQNGCREYTGNTGNNVRNIFTDDFFSGTKGNWTGIGGSTVDASNESPTLGPDNKGHSILVAGAGTRSAERPVGETVSQGSSYVLNFMAKASIPGNLALAISLGNGVANADFAPVTLTGNWQFFTANLTNLDHEVNSGEVLTLEASNNFYITNITLTEIVDRYYLIKDSWRTPESCDQDLDHNPYPFYMLGCAQYQDRDSKVHNLRQFSKLCSESAAGCELMIDTHNTNGPEASYYNNGQEVPFCVVNPILNSDCVKVPADNFIYAVYDREKLCGATEKGCELLGKPYTYEGAVVHSGVYLENNPDQYNQILCGADAVGCEAYDYGDGEKYFKDPGDQVCQWRTASGQGANQAWYKKKVKRCDSIGNICLADNDCLPNEKCQLETGLRCEGTDDPCKTDADCAAAEKCQEAICPTNTSKTFGYGGAGNSVPQPAQDNNENYWAGICQDEESGCSEYLDPVSRFNTNIIFNGSFQIIAASATDGWQTIAGGFGQEVNLEANTAYRLARNSDQPGELNITCASPTLYELDSDNSIFSINSPSMTVTVPELSQANSRIFYNKSENSGSCSISVSPPTGPVELKKVAIDYQLRANLDRQSCNGIANFGQGCVLFNERKQSGSSLVKLNWDADNTIDGQSPAASSTRPEENDSNLIIKVAPDRVCDKWLACKSYIKDSKGNNVCFDIGSCDAVDANGNCRNFLNEDKRNQQAQNLGDRISNLSGYAKVGINGGSLATDYYPLAKMEQVGEVANASNGGFEFYGANLYPIGWAWGNQGGGATTWSVNLFSVINNPIAAQTEGVNYAPEGASFLKLGSSFTAESEQIDVIPSTDYIITAYINTKNLKKGEAAIDILNSDSTVLAPKVAKQDLGKDWQFQLGKFTTGVSSTIKIRLRADPLSVGDPEGNFYYDDIKIKPALNSKDNWYTPQTCRLYPQSDSLACDYYEDSGKRQKGWPGYCLEYDRRPGDPDVCLLWYPIDKVKGDGLEEGAGYQGKIPVFYCVDITASIAYEYRHAFLVCKNADDEGDSQCDCPLNYTKNCNSHGGGWLDPDHDCICIPKKDDKIKDEIKLDGSTDNLVYQTSIYSSTDGWYKTDNSLATFGPWGTIVGASNPYAKYLCPGGASSCTLSQELFRSTASCANVVQTVTATGQNKYWSSRVYKGTDYTVPLLDYQYQDDGAPFASMVLSSSALNPYDWDGDSAKSDNQPISYSVSASGLRSGKGYGCSPSNLCFYVVDDSAQDLIPYVYESMPPRTAAMGTELIKRLFARSYGLWTWGLAGSYTCSGGGLNGANCAGQPNNCPGGDCLPTVSSQKLCSDDRAQTCDVESCVIGTCGLAVENQNRCGGVAAGNLCCSGGSYASGVDPSTGCSGLPCTLGGTPLAYRCNGTGVLCCPNGGTCDVCTDVSDYGVILPSNTAVCSGGAVCLPTPVTLGYGTCDGTAAGDKCCLISQGNCIASTINLCAGGSNPGQACAGQFCTNGNCVYQAGAAGEHYIATSTGGWSPPPNLCNDTGLGARPVYSGDFCSMLPKIENIKIASSSNNYTINNTGFINLTFNTKVDSQQLPLVMYGVDWGDNSKTMVSGVEMRDKPNPNNPETIYHLYSYWDLKAKNSTDQGASAANTVYCGIADGVAENAKNINDPSSGFTCVGQACCVVKPKTRIKDNWGWCNKGTTINICNQWDDFPGWVVVYEK